MKRTQNADEITATLLAKGPDMLTWEYIYGPYSMPLKIEVPLTDTNKHLTVGDVATLRLQVLV